MPIAALLPILTELLSMAVKSGAADKIVSSVDDIWNVASSETAPTEAEMEQYHRALDAAHEALQKS